MSSMQQASFKTMLRELWRKSYGCWHYLQLADLAKIGKETTNLHSLTKKVACICAHSGKAVKDLITNPTLGIDALSLCNCMAQCLASSQTF
jgi:hypothetical protein